MKIVTILNLKELFNFHLTDTDSFGIFSYGHLIQNEIKAQENIPLGFTSSSDGQNILYTWKGTKNIACKLHEREEMH